MENKLNDDNQRLEQKRIAKLEKKRKFDNVERLKEKSETMLDPQEITPLKDLYGGIASTISAMVMLVPGMNLKGLKSKQVEELDNLMPLVPLLLSNTEEEDLKAFKGLLPEQLWDQPKMLEVGRNIAQRALPVTISNELWDFNNDANKNKFVDNILSTEFNYGEINKALHEMFFNKLKSEGIDVELFKDHINTKDGLRKDNLVDFVTNELFTEAVSFDERIESAPVTDQCLVMSMFASLLANDNEKPGFDKTNAAIISNRLKEAKGLPLNNLFKIMRGTLLKKQNDLIQGVSKSKETRLKM